MLLPMLELEDVRPGGVRPLLRREYESLVELGVFEGERIELLRGTLVTMSPQGDMHARIVTWLTRRLIEQTDRGFDVRPALPFAATDDSEPEPDLVVGVHDPAARQHRQDLRCDADPVGEGDVEAHAGPAVIAALQA